MISGAVIFGAATCWSFGAVILDAVMCFGFCWIWSIGASWGPPWDALRRSLESLGGFGGGAWKPFRLTGRVLCHSQEASGSFGSPWGVLGGSICVNMFIFNFKMALSSFRMT